MWALMYLSSELWTTPKSDVKERTFSTNNTITCLTHTCTHMQTCEDLYDKAKPRFTINGRLGEKKKRTHNIDRGGVSYSELEKKGRCYI